MVSEPTVIDRPVDSTAAAWVDQQKQFYATRPHEHLQYAAGSVYAAKLVDHVLRITGIQDGSTILEVGCGAGRFTIPLLERMHGTLTGFDLSPELLERQREHLKTVTLPRGNSCELVAGDIYAMDKLFEPQSFDHVVGFFFLHHLPTLAPALAQIKRVLRPGGKVVFVEPNRRNPLFLLQVLCCADMTWADEKGMFTLGTRMLRAGFQNAGFSGPVIETTGFFPPNILDKWPRTLGLENAIERIPFAKPVLPFRIIWSEAQ